MIKLSSLLEHILDHPLKGEAIQEAKRLERIDECGQLTHLEITPNCTDTEDTNGNCPTQCVYTPEREHEWVIFNPDFVHDGICWAEQSKYGEILWNNVPYDVDTLRFPSEAHAQAYITTHNITNAFPWAVPKLSEK